MPKHPHNQWERSVKSAACVELSAFGHVCAGEKNRTRYQKGLRDRNSPTCTLSQNGYGDPCSSLTDGLAPHAGLVPRHFDLNGIAADQFIGQQANRNQVRLNGRAREWARRAPWALTSAADQFHMACNVRTAWIGE